MANKIFKFEASQLKSAVAQSVSKPTAFYEWNSIDNKWHKMIESDPDAPDNLEPGDSDGQIIQVDK